MPSPTQGHVQTLTSDPAVIRLAPCPAVFAVTVRSYSRPFDGPCVAIALFSA